MALARRHPADQSLPSGSARRKLLPESGIQSRKERITSEHDDELWEQAHGAALAVTVAYLADVPDHFSEARSADAAQSWLKERFGASKMGCLKVNGVAIREGE